MHIEEVALSRHVGRQEAKLLGERGTRINRLVVAAELLDMLQDECFNRLAVDVAPHLRVLDLAGGEQLAERRRRVGGVLDVFPLGVHGFVLADGGQTARPLTTASPQFTVERTSRQPIQEPVRCHDGVAVPTPQARGDWLDLCLAETSLWIADAGPRHVLSPKSTGDAAIPEGPHPVELLTDEPVRDEMLEQINRVAELQQFAS